MAVSFYFELRDMSTEQAEQVLQRLGIDGKGPEGQLFHAEGPLEGGGTWVMDGWESPEVLGRFIEQRLLPIMKDLGVTPPQPTLLPTRTFLSQHEVRRF